MADIGRVGWRKPGSLIPWPGSFAATARRQIPARSSSLGSAAARGEASAYALATRAIAAADARVDRELTALAL